MIFQFQICAATDSDFGQLVNRVGVVHSTGLQYSCVIYVF